MWQSRSQDPELASENDARLSLDRAILRYFLWTIWHRDGTVGPMYTTTGPCLLVDAAEVSI